eukprot:GFUD01021831.1.p1 GENE.GFUD01021831.1~~GFUD01021831.1.p1  ORF type:complete len:257 (-),score=54.92 GFUD01021831.1:136-906(-)
MNVATAIFLFVMFPAIADAAQNDTFDIQCSPDPETKTMIADIKKKVDTTAEMQLTLGDKMDEVKEKVEGRMVSVIANTVAPNSTPVPMILKEVKFTGGQVGASSLYSSSSSNAAANAFLEGSASHWHSGRDAKGNGDKVYAFPHIIWYNFPNAFVPGRVSFRSRQGKGCDAGGCGATKYQFVGTNDDVCDQFSAWTVLCEDLSGIPFENKVSSKYCLVQDHIREPFKCLGVSVLDSSYTVYTCVSMNGIRMWKKEI